MAEVINMAIKFTSHLKANKKPKLKKKMQSKVIRPLKALNIFSPYKTGLHDPSGIIHNGTESVLMLHK